jgi:uncharacterized protein YbjT (DUF2867 family)
MFAITGITGHAIRAVVRDTARALTWARLGTEVAVADFLNIAAMQAAFADSADLQSPC